MIERRIKLDTAAFLDAPQAARISNLPGKTVRTILERFLAVSYEDVGKAPRLLDGDDLAEILRTILPRRFGVKDPLAVHVEAVLTAYLDFLCEDAVVIAAFELRRALIEHSRDFEEAVATGSAHADGVRVPSKGKTLEHKVDKSQRNGPCPCGSGKKFKKCCMRLGDG